MMADGYEVGLEEELMLVELRSYNEADQRLSTTFDFKCMETSTLLPMQYRWYVHLTN